MKLPIGKEDKPMTVGDRIRKQREKLGISQTDLAKKVKIAKQTLYKYETNIITNIPSNTVENIAEILNISPAYLMGWVEDNLTEENVDLIPDILSDSALIEHIKKLMKLNKEHQQTIYDNIAYWYEKEGH